jgi:hypothetical protein
MSAFRHEVILDADFEQQVLHAAAERIETIAQGMEDTARRLVPVDTGHLRDSIYHQVDLREAQITLGASADYAGYVEYGHHSVAGTWVPPQPFIRPAIYGSNFGE